MGEDSIRTIFLFASVSVSAASASVALAFSQFDSLQRAYYLWKKVLRRPVHSKSDYALTDGK